MLNNSSILITGGTGSFGGAFVQMTLKKYNPRRIVIFSRDEMKQWEMAKLYKNDSRIRFLIGDVRDKDRLYRALDGIDYVVHAAATKIVPTAEYDPFECVKTNVLGANGTVKEIFGFDDWQIRIRMLCLNDNKYTARQYADILQDWFEIAGSINVRGSIFSKKEIYNI